VLLGVAASLLAVGANVTSLPGIGTPSGATSTHNGTTTTVAQGKHPPSNPNAPLVIPTTTSWPLRGCGIDSMAVTAHPSATRPIGKCVVLEVGDSLGNDVGWGLGRELGGYHDLTLVQKDKSDTGIATSWYYNWTQQLNKYLKLYHPQLVVFCIGANDEQNIKLKGRILTFGTKPWITEYGLLVSHLVALAHANGAQTLWLGLPVVEDPGYREGIELLNAIDRASSTQLSGTAFLPTWAVLAGPGDSYQQDGRIAGHEQDLRSPDGVHLSGYGEDVMATFVARELALIYHVNVKPERPVVLQ
jgi:hypothetical protein